MFEKGWKKERGLKGESVYLENVPLSWDLLHFFIPSKIPRKSGCVKIQALRKWELEKLKQYYAVVNLHIGKKPIMIILHVRHQMQGSGLWERLDWRYAEVPFRLDYSMILRAYSEIRELLLSDCSEDWFLKVLHIGFSVLLYDATC